MIGQLDFPVQTNCRMQSVGGERVVELFALLSVRVKSIRDDRQGFVMLWIALSHGSLRSTLCLLLDKGRWEVRVGLAVSR